MKLTHDVQLVLCWQDNIFDIYNPAGDNSIDGPVPSENDGKEMGHFLGKRYYAPATLHLPLNGEKPFLTVGKLRYRDPEVEGWDAD